MSKTVRSVSFGLATIVTTLAVLPVSGEFFVKLAEENGLYERPTERVGSIMSAISDLVGNPVFPWIAGIIIGFAVGVWLDAWMRRFDQGRSKSTSAPAWRPEGLHVSGMTVNAKRLYTDHYIEIAVHGFNATGGPISIGEASGNVMFREDVNSAPELSKSLPSPRVQYDRYPSKDIPNLTRIDVLIEQRVPNDITEIVRSRLEAQKRVRLDFNSLTIMVASDAEGSSAIRLPIWTSASLYQNADQINVTPVFEAQAALTVGLQAGHS